MLNCFLRGDSAEPTTFPSTVIEKRIDLLYVMKYRVLPFTNVGAEWVQYVLDRYVLIHSRLPSVPTLYTPLYAATMTPENPSQT